MWNPHRIDVGVQQNAANLSALTTIGTAVTGKRLSPRKIIVSSSAIANFYIQDNAATPVVLLGRKYMPINAVLVLNFEAEDSPKGTSGTAIQIISSTTDAMSVESWWYVLDS